MADQLRHVYGPADAHERRGTRANVAPWIDVRQIERISLEKLSGFATIRVRSLLHREDHVTHDRIDLLLPPLAVEHAVVADIGLQMMAFEVWAE